MFHLHETVVLTRNLPSRGLAAGDMGAVVHVHDDEACEVEFVTGEGETAALLTLSGEDIRAMRGDELPHARAYHKATG
jgi:hypothetical protein